MTSDLQARLLDLRKAFLRELPDRLESLRKAWDRFSADGGEALGLEAHRLAGAAGTFGQPALSEGARRLEAQLQAEGGADPAELERLLQALEQIALGLSLATPAGDIPPPPDAPVPTPGGAFAALTGDPGTMARVQEALAALGHTLPCLEPAQVLSAAFQHRPPEVLIVACDLLTSGIRWGSALGGLALPPALLFVSEGDGSAERLKAVREGGEGFFTLPDDLPALADRLDSLRLQHSETPFHVVVLEDDLLVLEEHAALLRGAGLRVSAASDAAATLEACRSGGVDLILLDWHLGDCTGPEVAAMLRQVGTLAGVPIVFLSSERSLARQMSALHRGADSFLTKPIPPAHLIGAVLAQARRGRVLRGYMSRDGLTGLLNHSAIEQRVEEELALARRAGHPLSLAMLDLDHFKRVNDTYGHAMGDRVLKGFCQILSRRLRRSDVLGRYGGEEFVALLPGTAPEEARGLMERILQEFRDLRFPSPEGSFTCAFSGGIAGFPGQDSAAALRDAADAALYEAKGAGRARIVVAGPAPGSQAGSDLGSG